ncbi:MAG: hypothetical protein D6698_16360 [Gammaproteobacteria bacterium]|nr:MAG: hypothetical protein D6698_16360 [Gammaproteobacteria bacterium]
MDKNRFSLDTISEFAGNVPVVPLAEGVDLELLTRGDDDPMFVTLPVAEAETLSENKRYYDETFVRELERQILDKRPVAHMGHLRDEDRATAHPLPAGYWVGAARQNKTLWAKAYIPPGAVKEDMRRQKAINGKVGTSVYGTARHEWDAGLNAYRVKDFVLETIDFGPPERIGVRSLAAVPQLTSEFMMEGETMDRIEVIREMTAADAAILPEAVRKAVLDTAPEKQVVAELRQLLNNDGGDLIAVVQEIVSERDKLRAAVVEQEISAQVAEQIKLESVRGIVAELVKARNPKDADAVKGIVAEVAASDAVKPLLANALQRAMGPTQERPGGGVEDNEKFSMLKPKPEAAK